MDVIEVRSLRLQVDRSFGVSDDGKDHRVRSTSLENNNNKSLVDRRNKVETH